MGASPSLLYPSLDAAIAQAEGFGTPNATTINAANNPGAITVPPSGQLPAGATGELTSGAGVNFAVFPSVAAGQAAEDSLINNYAEQGYTIQQLGQMWACGADATCQSSQANQNYVASLAAATGLPANTPLTTLQGQLPGSPPPVTNSSSGTSSVFRPGGMVANTLGGTGCAIATLFGQGNGCSITGGSSTNAPSSAGLSFGRIGAFILGFIVIAGAIYLFGRPQINRALAAV